MNPETWDYGVLGHPWKMEHYLALGRIWVLHLRIRRFMRYEGRDLHLLHVRFAHLLHSSWEVLYTVVSQTVSAFGTKTKQRTRISWPIIRWWPLSGRSNTHVLCHGIKGELDSNKAIFINMIPYEGESGKTLIGNKPASTKLLSVSPLIQVARGDFLAIFSRKLR